MGEAGEDIGGRRKSGAPYATPRRRDIHGGGTILNIYRGFYVNNWIGISYLGGYM